MAEEVFDLLVSGGTLVCAGRAVRGSLAVKNGKIMKILAGNDDVPARERYDARLLHVFPGIVDPHVHTRHPGGEEREDFQSGTAAAAAGGICTIIEMPVSTTPANSVANIEARVAAMQPQAHVDFALYGAAGRDNVDTILDQARAGIVAFKTFLQPPPKGREAEFRGLWCRHDEIRTIMDAVRYTGLRHLFHCEEPGVYQPLQARLEGMRRTTGRALEEARPTSCEEVSAAIVLARAVERPLPVGIVHCSSPMTARLAGDARYRGLNVTVEACIPQLFGTVDDLDRFGAYAKSHPPMRAAKFRDSLWHAIQGGLIEYLGTDHSPFTVDEKDRHGDDIFKTPPGLASLDLYMPLLLTAASQRRISLPQIAAVCAENPAYVFKLRDKGRIYVGADADFTIVDTRRRWRFDASKAFSKARGTMRMFDGMTLKGAVVSTIVRGQRVYQDGEVLSPPGFGQFVKPDLEWDAGRPIAGLIWGAGPL